MTSGPLEATILYTDQTQCYDELGHVIPCTGSGQDGEYSDCPRTASERFQLEGSLVLDSVTGFRWCRDANPAGFPLSWEEAHALIREMNRTGALGRADWALPSRQQLFTLVSHETTRPALPIGHPFVNVFGGWYWTGTPCRHFPAQAWSVDIGGGRVQRGMKHRAYLVWPIASGTAVQPDATGAIRLLDDGTLIDERAGLLWRLPAEPDRKYNWRGALEAVRGMNSERANGSGWRLPNVRRLESLMHALDETTFPGSPEGLWSSTTSAYDPTYAWVVYPVDGSVGVGFKQQRDFQAVAVRTVQQH